jgi:hypothetical protein
MRDLKYILGILIAAIAILLIVNWMFPGVSAIANVTNTTNVTISNSSFVISDEPTYGFTPEYRLDAQGGTVYINDTIDNRGQGWNKALAWYGKYSESDDARYILDYNYDPYSTKNPKHFYIDPAIFSGRSGAWYQYYGNATERNGNLIAFVVKEEYRNYTMTLPNGEVFNMSMAISNSSRPVDAPIPKEQIMPEVPVTGYLIPHGESLTTNLSKVWLFGNTKGLYDRTGDISKADIQSLPVGSYKLVKQEPGNNTIIEVGYDSTTNQLTSPWKGIASIPIDGLQPMMVLDQFVNMERKTDDKIETYNMEIQEPDITINKIDEVDVGTRIQIKYEPGLTLLDVRGYSNVANGTKLYFVMDPDKQTVRSIERNTFITEAIKTSPGNKSYYRMYIPINKNTMYNGIHTIKAYTDIGGSVYSDFPVSEMPADSYVPNASLKYIGDSNPWKPNMTIPDPIIVVQTQRIVEYVKVNVTPEPEALNAAQKKAVAEKVGEIVTDGIIIGVVILGLFLVGRYLYRVNQKRKWYRK